MKNREKYRETIMKPNDSFCNDFIRPIILKGHCFVDSESELGCEQCAMIQALWLDEEYVEPKVEVDWSRVKIDTPIYIRDTNTQNWGKRHFAKYEDGKIFAWADGHTSFTENATTQWAYAKLPDGIKPEDVYEK